MAEEVKSFTVRLPRELGERLEIEAYKRVVGVNFIITRAIEDFLRQLPPLPDVFRRPEIQRGSEPTDE